MQTQYENQGGLLVIPGTNQCAGYIFNFDGQGAYAPEGKIKVGDAELTQEQVDEHNRLLGEMEKQAAIEHGKAVFYFSYKAENTGQFNARTGCGIRRYSEFKVANWCGSWKSPYTYATKSFTPGFNCGERWHVYFTGPDGKKWYGINQGDHQIVRARRLKKQT